jgi:signal transduction histidine kinase/CheY-like chemotaxis protein
MDILRSVLLLPMVLVSGLAIFFAVSLYKIRRRLQQTLTQESEQLANILQLENQLIQARRMEAVGILAGGIVNNLNNLLAVIMGHTRMAKHELPPNSKAQEELDRVMKAGHMASDLVREISDFYRQADQARKPTDLLPVVRDTVKLLRDILPSTVTVISDLKPGGPVLVTTTGVQQMLMNLCSNSLNAMYRQQGTLEISLAEEVVTGWHKAAPQELGPGSYVRLSVRDDGKGMDKETLDRIFESYFTGNGDSDKMGIGLSTVYRILEDHDGVTIARSQIGRGTTFDIFFPLIAWSVSTPATGPEAVTTDIEIAQPYLAPVTSLHGPNLNDTEFTGQDTTETAGSKATVLLVDDEEMVCQVLTRGLQRLGYRVIAHSDSRKALADFAQTPDIFDIVVTDQIMPHMSGVRLTRKIHDLRADLPIILFTGFRDSFNENQAREAGVSEFMLKPSSHRDLADLIDRVVLRRNESRN